MIHKVAPELHLTKSSRNLNNSRIGNRGSYNTNNPIKSSIKQYYLFIVDSIAKGKIFAKYHNFVYHNINKWRGYNLDILNYDEVNPGIKNDVFLQLIKHTCIVISINGNNYKNIIDSYKNNDKYN